MERKRQMIHRTIVALAMAAVATTAATAQPLDICSGPDRAIRNVTCIHDGDTGWEKGLKWRMIGVDTPEFRPHAECAAEIELAAVARDRLIALMSEGYTIISSDRYDDSERLLVDVELSDGRDAGHVLLYEGLAQPWPNNENPWCAPS